MQSKSQFRRGRLCQFNESVLTSTNFGAFKKPFVSLKLNSAWKPPTAMWIKVSENPKWGTIAEFALGNEVWQVEYNATFPHHIPKKMPTTQRELNAIHCWVNSDPISLCITQMNPLTNTSGWHWMRSTVLPKAI